jgi:CheY-like chemotaxis protein
LKKDHQRQSATEDDSTLGYIFTMSDFEVVLICNHPSEQFLFAEFLRFSNITNILTTSTQSALSKITTEIRLAVICLHENDSETLTLIAAIRNQFLDLPIIVLSPSSMPLVRQQAKEAGSSNYVVMPIPLIKFSELIHTLFPHLK